MGEEGAPLTDDQLGALILALAKREVAPWLDLARVIVPAAGFIGVFVSVASHAGAGHADFYKTAATVIPTLLLTLAVQGRFFRLSAVARSPLYQEIKGKQVTRKDLHGLGVPAWTSWVFLLSLRWLMNTSRITLQYTILLLLSIAGGEAAALFAVAGGRPSPALLGVVSAAIAAGFLAIAVIAMFGVGPESASGKDPVHEWSHVVVELTRRREQPPTTRP